MIAYKDWDECIYRSYGRPRQRFLTAYYVEKVENRKILCFENIYVHSINY